MAGTVTFDTPKPFELQDSGAGKRKACMISGSIAINETYSTGGIDCGTQISSRFKTLKRVIASCPGFACNYDVSTNKLLLYGDQAAASLNNLDEPNTVATGAITAQFIAFGF